MPISLIALVNFAIVAVAGHHACPNLIAVLVSLARANVETWQYETGAKALRVWTAEQIEGCANVTTGVRRTVRAAVEDARAGLVALTAIRRACIASDGTRFLTGAEELAVEHLYEAICRVERAVREAPEGASVEDLARGCWTGPRYVDGRELAAVARDVRKDLAAAAKAPGLLHGVTCRVRKDGHAQLEVEIVAVGDGAIVVNRARVAADMADKHGPGMLPLLGEQGTQIAAAVERIVNAYSMRRSDGVQAFRVDVEYGHDLCAGQRAEVERLVRLLVASTATAA